MKKQIKCIRNKVKDNMPLIHCITNPISINQCANALLAIGARPIMAEHPKEVRQITSTAQAVLLNLGNITDVRMEAMKLSLAAAKEKNIPVVLDAVGIACSDLRRNYTNELLNIGIPEVIKGNYSEINALYCDMYSSAGVDADEKIDIGSIDRAAMTLAEKYNTTILASGKTDIVTDGKQLIHIKNGTRQLASVTGTGCMLGSLCAAYLSQTGIMQSGGIEAAMTACVVLGICGQLAQTDEGNGTFMVRLMDYLTTLTHGQVDEYIEVN